VPEPWAGQGSALLRLLPAPTLPGAHYLRKPISSQLRPATLALEREEHSSRHIPSVLSSTASRASTGLTCTAGRQWAPGSWARLLTRSHPVCVWPCDSSLCPAGVTGGPPVLCVLVASGKATRSQHGQDFSSHWIPAPDAERGKSFLPSAQGNSMADWIPP
jgi:hypothetical protein